MVATLGFFEYFELRTFDLTMDPLLRFPRYYAGSTADDQGRKVDPRDEISPIHMPVIVGESPGKMPRHLQITLDNPLLQLWCCVLSHSPIDDLSGYVFCFLAP